MDGKTEKWEEEMMEFTTDDLSRHVEAQIALPGLQIMNDRAVVDRSLFTRCKESRPAAAGSDTMWLTNVQAYCLDWNLNSLLGDAASQAPPDGWSARLSRLPSFMGSDKYESSRFYCSGPTEVHSIMAGGESDILPFLKAEGQIYRCMLSCDGHAARLDFLRIWMTMMARQCGPSSVSGLHSAVIRLRGMDWMFGGCCPNRGSFEAFDRLYTSKLKLYGAWLYAMRHMNRIRETYLGEWAFDVDLCAVHCHSCAMYMEDIPLEWEDTEPEDGDEFDEEGLERAEKEEKVARSNYSDELKRQGLPIPVELASTQSDDDI